MSCSVSIPYASPERACTLHGPHLDKDAQDHRGIVGRGEDAQAGEAEEPRHEVGLMPCTTTRSRVRAARGGLPGLRSQGSRAAPLLAAKGAGASNREDAPTLQASSSYGRTNNMSHHKLSTASCHTAQHS
jgi:hypothetical protein